MSPSPRHSVSRCSITAVVAASLIATVLIDIRARFFVPHPPLPAVSAIMEDDPRLDQLILSGPTTGNVYSYFRNFTPAFQSLLMKIYTRGCYDLYPRKFLISEPSAVIFSEQQAMQGNFAPAISWLQSHDVQKTITWTPGPVLQIDQVEVPRRSATEVHP